MDADGTRDWAKWHREYDDPSSRLSRRLRVVREELRRAIDATPGPLRIISMCAGEGRDVIPMVADHPRRGEITARLVELDPRNATAARAAVVAAGLEAQIEVVEADAGLSDSYTGAVPAEIVLACGVFGNISDDDVRRTIGYLPRLCAAGATVLWTRGCERDRDIPGAIRRWFVECGFDEVVFVGPDDTTFTVGVARLRDEPPAFEPGVTMFRFVR
jgi:hypothetical protein